MLLWVVVGLLVVVSLVAFVVPLRAALGSRRRDGPAPRAPRPVSDGTTFVGLDHLAVGVELKFDGQTWFVVGVQRAAPADGAWTAWHLDDRGQGGLMLTTGRDDEVVMAVRAERPETLDPAADVQRWRDHDWVRTEASTAAVRVEGERRGPRRGVLAPVPPADVERGVWVREELPTRRLVLERSVGEESWNAWVGTAVPGRLVDVWPPAPGGGTPAPASAGDVRARSPRAGGAVVASDVQPPGPRAPTDPREDPRAPTDPREDPRAADDAGPGPGQPS